MLDLTIYDPNDRELHKLQKEYLRLLLKGESDVCVQLALDLVSSPSDILNLYLGVIQPSMYTIGHLWETNRISVAHEHLASAIVSRTLTATYVERISIPSEKKGKILISPSSNELHEIGSWMVSDMFELEGWEVKYVGSDSNHQELFTVIQDFKPDIVGFSVTMDYNIHGVADVVRKIRQAKTLDKTKILLGGAATCRQNSPCLNLDVDGMAADGLEAIKLVRSLC